MCVSKLPLRVQVIEQKEQVRAAMKAMAATSNKAGQLDCLPETMPPLLFTPYMQSLQQPLLTLQVTAPFHFCSRSILSHDTCGVGTDAQLKKQLFANYG